LRFPAGFVDELTAYAQSAGQARASDGGRHSRLR
jgi:hypothetical protein